MSANDLKKHRLFFSDLGFAYVVFAIVSYVLEFFIAYTVKSYAPNFYNSQLFIWAGSFLPMYLIAFPMCLLVFKHIPKTPITKEKLSISKLPSLFATCIFAMLAGNLVGRIITFVLNKLTGYTSSSIVNEMVMSSKLPYLIIFAVILAPIFEELLFRKLLIDRARKYGDITAILLSGILFGLFHGNFEQFFYAAFLGTIFAYIYVKTGNIKYTISLHMIINFLGSVVPLFILSRLDDQTRETILSSNTNNISLSPEIISALSISLIYSLSLFVIGIIGLVCFCKLIKKLSFNKNSFNLSHNEMLQAIFFNLGMPCFIVICILKFVLNI